LRAGPAGAVPPQPAGVEIAPLTSIRGVVALWVVAFHLFKNLAHHGVALTAGTLAYRALSAGQFGVDIFFILSGFIIARTYRALTAGGIPEFLFRRFARIYPLHFVVLSLMVPGVFVLGMIGRTPGDADYFAYHVLPYHFALTFAWFGQPIGWNAPAWSLSIEVLAYAAFPGLLMLSKRLPAPARILLAALCAVAAIWTLRYLGFANTGVGAIARGLLGFTIGVLMQSVAPSGFTVPLVPSAALMALIALATLSDDSIVLAPLAATILIPALAGRGRDPFISALSTAPALLLGRISYSVYLLHFPLLLVWLNLLRLPFFAAHSGLSVAVFIGSYLSVLLGISRASYSLIETRARAALQALWKRRYIAIRL
jgi:peptidoglycan/LPS O-acetylase OafA/YrhL